MVFLWGVKCKGNALIKAFKTKSRGIKKMIFTYWNNGFCYKYFPTKIQGV